MFILNQRLIVMDLEVCPSSSEPDLMVASCEVKSTPSWGRRDNVTLTIINTRICVYAYYRHGWKVTTDFSDLSLSPREKRCGACSAVGSPLDGSFEAVTLERVEDSTSENLLENFFACSIKRTSDDSLAVWGKGMWTNFCLDR
jgi:hypothetical protein